MGGEVDIGDVGSLGRRSHDSAERGMSQRRTY